jgi:hypothetical protein
VHPAGGCVHYLAADKDYAGYVAALSWSAGGGTILMLRNFNKCKTIHTKQSKFLSFFQSNGILPHRNISCRASETGRGLRTMNTVAIPLLFGPSKNSQIAISDAILY